MDFYLDIKIEVSEMKHWPPMAIATFFDGIATITKAREIGLRAVRETERQMGQEPTLVEAKQ